MSRNSTPGSPAGRPAAPGSHRARSFDYPEADELDENALDPALATSPGHGGVGVFQAPRPLARRNPPADPVTRRATPAEQPPPRTPSPTGAESPDIDSPFLDLFGAPRPGTARPLTPARRAEREHAPIPPQPAAIEPAAPVTPARSPGAGQEPAPTTAPPRSRNDRLTGPSEPVTRSRVPHQAGDRLPARRPAVEPEPVVEQPPPTPPAPALP
ncbi:hypothetical protein E1211_27675, partial [Micromonospora sp. 15K316]